MELEDLGPPTFAAHVVKYRGLLLELKTSNNLTGFHNINCARDTMQMYNVCNAHVTYG